MYLLRKLGIPLAALLILSILTLVTVILIFDRNGILLPSFERPETEPPVTTTTIEPEISVNNNYDNINILYIGGILK